MGLSIAPKKNFILVFILLIILFPFKNASINYVFADGGDEQIIRETIFEDDTDLQAHNSNTQSLKLELEEYKDGLPEENLISEGLSNEKEELNTDCYNQESCGAIEDNSFIFDQGIFDPFEEKEEQKKPDFGEDIEKGKIEESGELLSTNGSEIDEEGTEGQGQIEEQDDSGNPELVDNHEKVENEESGELLSTNESEIDEDGAEGYGQIEEQDDSGNPELVDNHEKVENEESGELLSTNESEIDEDGTEGYGQIEEQDDSADEEQSQVEEKEQKNPDLSDINEQKDNKESGELFGSDEPVLHVSEEEQDNLDVGPDQESTGKIKIEALDPFFTRNETTFYYRSNCTGFDNCIVSETPITDAILDINNNGSADNNTIYIEGGLFNEEILITKLDQDLILQGGVNGEDSVLQGVVKLETIFSELTFKNFIFDNTVLIDNSENINIEDSVFTNQVEIIDSQNISFSENVLNNTVAIENSEVSIVGTNNDDMIIIEIRSNSNKVIVDGGEGDDKLIINTSIASIDGATLANNVFEIDSNQLNYQAIENLKIVLDGYATSIKIKENISLDGTLELNATNDIIIEPDVIIQVISSVLINADSDQDGLGNFIISDGATIEMLGQEQLLISAADIVIQGDIVVPSGIVNLLPSRDDTDISIGSPNEKFSLSSDEMENIQTKSLIIGDQFIIGSLIIDGVDLSSMSYDLTLSAGEISLGNVELSYGSIFQVLAAFDIVDIN